MILRFAQVLSRRRLFSSQTCEPYFEWFERLYKRLYLAQLAAPCGIFAIQDAKLGFLLRHGFCRSDVDEVQAPFAGNAVSKLIGIAEVVAGFKKQHRNLRQAPPQ